METIEISAPVLAHLQIAAYAVKPGHAWAWYEIVKARAIDLLVHTEFGHEALECLIPPLRALSRVTVERTVTEVEQLLNSVGVGIFGRTGYHRSTDLRCQFFRG
ncbi:hypothetical protein CPHO_03850 [Corynebacterium phocae]|uniref:Uncharacterized protein n=1 Tax=Corynebacterium phocae TaxID=161895 RepID=A0A1L7D2F8_9CORY|nr:hypothetical protein CPHO_03850 [Corynebacterium phocae]